MLGLPDRVVVHMEASSGAFWRSPLTGVAHRSVMNGYRHACDEVREPVEPARRRDRQPAARVEAEKVDARLSVHVDIRADVDLGESGKKRKRPSKPGPEVANSERSDTD